jgi:hypothetical protein
MQSEILNIFGPYTILPSNVLLRRVSNHLILFRSLHFNIYT